MESERIGIFEAKTHFSEIIDKVVREGRSVTVTRRGKPMVEISPSSEVVGGPRMTKAEALAALEELRARLRLQMNQGDIAQLIEEGRDRCPDL